jgi:SpoU rRNA methylase family enzyme
VVFSDGRVALRWRTSTSSTCVYDSIEDVMKIHGHEGATQVLFLDEIEDATDMATEPLFDQTDEEPAVTAEPSPLEIPGVG